MADSEILISIKKAFQYLYNILGTTAFSFAIPVIMFKVIRSIYFNQNQKTLAGKVVVITGASSGLGEALSHEFYKNGSQVILCARRRQELERVRNDLLQMYSTTPTHPPIIIPLDLSDLTSLENVVEKILSITSHVDILINNAGISHRGTVVNTNVEVDKKIMTVNYFGTITLTKALLPSMIKRQIGHIVMISSVQGLIALPNRSAYSASKHALQAFSDSLRAEVAASNIFVTVISPGYIKTSLSINALTASGKKYSKMDDTTAKGFNPEDVAKEVIQAIIQKKNEVIVSSSIPRIVIILRKYFPWLYFFIMAKRATKLETT
ncbi:dehydrogenase/reductase SDR family protein 7-like [Agrilus planipennis]|uniref:Dehydrogenase/reductase SDR family protein 7-like n=1 Tax=Agrilus planipennis TaxID=224129 RepID=A0A1W4WJT9_AGRPL|nr:dehydrogenase/reductase SDR family protein 7-like [Agrilus planipennis]